MSREALLAPELVDVHHRLQTQRSTISAVVCTCGDSHAGCCASIHQIQCMGGTGGQWDSTRGCSSRDIRSFWCSRMYHPMSPRSHYLRPLGWVCDGHGDSRPVQTSRMAYRPNPCQESQPLTREAAGRPQDCDCLSSSVRWAQRTKPTLGVNVGL